MAVDLQVIYPQDLVPLTSVTEERGPVGQRLLRLTGGDFRTVDEVLVNETRSPLFTINGPTLLIATVPESIGLDPINGVTVFSNKITLSGRSLIRFKLGDVTGKCSGMLRLMQFFLKILFTSPGRDIFDPNLGGDALKNIGHPFGKGQGSSLISDFVIAVNKSSRQIISLQTQDNRVPRDERLLTATVDSAKFDRDQAALITTTTLTNQAGKVGIANVII